MTPQDALDWIAGGVIAGLVIGVAIVGLQLFLVTRNQRIERRDIIMSKQLDDLTAQVAATTAVEASALTLIKGLSEQLGSAGTDPAKLDELRTQLDASAQALAAAVAANTPAAPAPPAPAPAG